MGIRKFRKVPKIRRKVNKQKPREIVYRFMGPKAAEQFDKAVKAWVVKQKKS